MSHCANCYGCEKGISLPCMPLQKEYRMDGFVLQGDHNKIRHLHFHMKKNPFRDYAQELQWDSCDNILIRN